MPGFTPMSMFPRMWAATGLDYPALVDRLIQLALQPRHRPALTAAAHWQGVDRASQVRRFDRRREVDHRGRRPSGR